MHKYFFPHYFLIVAVDAKVHDALVVKMINQAIAANENGNSHFY